jgi:hypothetical protein
MKHAREDYNRIQDPSSKIPEDEPVMLFRAQDMFFLDVLQHYSDLLKKAGNGPSQAVAKHVDKHMIEAHEWRKKNEHKLKYPDL